MSTSTSPVDIRADHLEIVQDILRTQLPASVKVWVFGSRANWTTKDSSDLDLAVEGAASLDHGVMVGLEIAFEESDLPYTVDVVDLNGVSHTFRQIVEGQRVPLPMAGGRAKMGVERPEVTLGDVAEIVMGQSPPGEAVSKDHGLALLNGPTEFGSHHPTPVQFTVDPRKFAEPGDILFCVRGSTTGRMNWADQEYAVGRGVAAIRHREEPALQPFVRGVIEFELPELLAQATGSTFPNVSASQLAGIPYPGLDKDEQRAIAHILGTLDDKIELNRRTSQTLEEMARAIFQDWFVDFGPVRAKLEGREPYLTVDLWSLFPDRLVDSELGEIPEGWDVEALVDSFNLTMGQSPPGSTYNDHGEGLPFFQGSTDFGPRFPENRKYCTAPTRVAQANDTLVSVRAPVGTLNIAWEQCCIGRGVASIRHKSGSSSFTFYSAWGMKPELKQYEQTGTVFGAITRKQFENLQVIVPSNLFVDAFDSFVLPLEQHLRHNSASTRTLSSQRDALLPRLVSGEVRLNNTNPLLEGIG